MKKEISQNLSIYRVLAILILLLGLTLMTYMIVAEDEPGAFPLLLVLIGIVSLIIIRIKIRRQEKIKSEF